MNLCVNLLRATFVCSVNIKLSSLFSLQHPKHPMLMIQEGFGAVAGCPAPWQCSSPRLGTATSMNKPRTAICICLKYKQCKVITSEHSDGLGSSLWTHPGPKCSYKRRTQWQILPGTDLGSAGQTAGHGLQSQPYAAQLLPPTRAANSYWLLVPYQHVERVPWTGREQATNPEIKPENRNV